MIQCKCTVAWGRVTVVNVLVPNTGKFAVFVKRDVTRFAMK